MENLKTATVSRKIGQNRGKPRLWLEGKVLTDAGFKHGKRWNLVPTPLGFDIVESDDGKRKIAGKPDRPIIDIAGASLGDLGNAQTVKVEFIPGNSVLFVTKES